MSVELDINDFSNGSVVSGAWDGTGVFDEIVKAVNGNLQLQYDEGRIKGTDFANAYINGLQVAVTEAMKYMLNRKSIEKQLELQDVQIAINEVQLAENSEKWALQKQVLENQLEMSNVDVQYKEQNVLRDLEIRDKQIESAVADIAFNESKRTIMEYTRNDNIRSKAAEQFAEFIKYLSAANVVPGQTDFKNMRNLIEAMNNGIINPENSATIIQTTGAAETTKDYVKPV